MGWWFNCCLSSVSQPSLFINSVTLGLFSSIVLVISKLVLALCIDRLGL